jgi:hypothetical protein
MMGFTRRFGAAVAVLAVWAAGPAAAQENLDQGKTPAQLYASDCAICHKSPRGLAKRARRYGLDSFLRAHYTASREAAAAISAYLQSIDRRPASRRKHNSKRKAKASTPKLPPRKPPEGKSSETISSETKASDTKPAASQPAEAKAEAPKADPPKPAQNSKDTKPDKSD